MHNDWESLSTSKVTKNNISFPKCSALRGFLDEILLYTSGTLLVLAPEWKGSKPTSMMNTPISSKTWDMLNGSEPSMNQQSSQNFNSNLLSDNFLNLKVNN